MLNELVEKTEFGSSLVILDEATREVVFIDQISGYMEQMPLERLDKLGETVRKRAGNVSRLLGYRGR